MFPKFHSINSYRENLTEGQIYWLFQEWLILQS